MKKNIAYNPQSTGGRWIENASDGLRFVGTANALAPRVVKHTGWYMDDAQDQTVTGAVWQLPARHGKPQYVGGYINPYNADWAFICFDDITDDPITAVVWGDHMAECMAEQSREDDGKLQEELRREAEELRRGEEDDARSEIEEYARVA
jgi:hypothetical protein